MSRPAGRRRWVPAAALGVAVAEVATFVGLGSLLGYGVTLLLVVAISLLGLVLLRREGLRAWRGFRQAVAAAAPPGPQVTDGVVGLGGALLLAAPGVVTGVAGAALLVPPVRRLARSRVQARAERRMSSAEAGEVFGPRRVRVQREQPDQRGQPAPEPPDADRARPDGPDGEIVEGEIVDDR